MSVLAVKTGVMNQCASSEQDIAKRISSISGEIDNIRQNLSFNIRARANINSQLITLKKVCQTNASHVASLQSVLKDAVTAYTQAEKNVCSLADGVAAAAASTGAAASSKPSAKDKSNTTKEQKSSWWEKLLDVNAKDISKVVGNFGTAGKAVQTVIAAVTGDKLGAVKGVVSTVGSFAKSGWSDMLKQGEWKNLKETVGKYSFSSGSKLSAAANWAGSLLTVAGNFASNYEEYGGDLSNSNIYAETVLETVVSSGIKYAVGAGVTAVAGPVVGKWASIAVGYVDSKLGVSDKISKGIISGVKKIGEGASKAKNSIASWFRR